jgi:hypothetical protein
VRGQAWVSEQLQSADVNTANKQIVLLTYEKEPIPFKAHVLPLVFIDNVKIAEYEKAIPADLLFNAMSFFSFGSTGEPDKLYISNIKITKD